jgi:heterodisulfide reductase subunit A
MADNPILVIGGGPAGLAAAKGVADLGRKAILVEKHDALGGTPIQENYAALTPDFRNAEDAMGEMIQAVTGDDGIEVLTSSTVTLVEGEGANIKVNVQNGSGSKSLDVSGVIVSTGFEHFDPGHETQVYGYYEYDDVITLTDAEKMLKEHKFVKPSNGETPESVCFIQCVGSRDRQIGNQWCSKVCCGIASKDAIEIKQILPDAKVFVFYIDLRAYGCWEDELYWKAQEEYKVNYIKGIVTEITRQGDKLIVKGEDTTMGRPMEIPMDVVVLSTGMSPSEGTKDMAGVFNLPLESHGYIATIGGPLNTVETSVPGIFVAGAATGPADLEDSVSMGGNAAMKACAFAMKN